jgi:hypothetical protein
MRKFGVLVAVTAGVAFGTAALASGEKVRGSGKRHGARIFTIYAPTAPGRFALLPVTPGEFSLGARDVFSDDLFTSKGGRSLGSDGGVCTVTRVADASTGSGTLECEVTFSLPGGQIATQALNTVTNGNLSGTQPGAITGGTGRYRGATGEIVVKFLSSTEADVTFVLER